MCILCLSSLSPLGVHCMVSTGIGTVTIIPSLMPCRRNPLNESAANVSCSAALVAMSKEVTTV